MYEILFVLGGILIIGFAAEYFFKMTKISSVVTLMIIGLLLGPVFHIVDVSPNSSIRMAAPVIGAITLMVILFDAGTKMNLRRLVQTLPKASLFIVLNFVLTLFFIGLVVHHIFGWDWMYALILGATVGGISSPIVILFVNKLELNENVKTVLTLESTLTDVLCILTAVILIQYVLSSAAGDTLSMNVTGMFAGLFSVSILYGIIVAAIWIIVLKDLPKQEKCKYALTIGLLLILYYLTEVSGGSGPIAVFIFGLILAHVKDISKWVKIDKSYFIEKKFLTMQDEVTFFVRTYFFVYIGLLITIDGINLYVIGFSVLMIVLTVLARFISTNVLFFKESAYNKTVMIGMIPRGLAAAVLASMPFSYNLNVPSSFETIVFLVIFLSNIITSVWVFGVERHVIKKSHEKINILSGRKIRKLNAEKQ